MLLVIDPGARSAGCALFEDKELKYAWLAQGKNWIETADNVTKQVPVSVVRTLVFEKMQVYKETSPGIADDLITLSLMAGRVTGRFLYSEIVEYRPAQWKGQVPKKIMLGRIRAKLSAEELAVIEKAPASKMHNIWDAIGIGLFHLKRRSRGKNDQDQEGNTDRSQYRNRAP